MPKTQSAPQQDACFRTCLHKKHMWIFEHNLPKRHAYTLVKTGSQSTFSYSYGKCDKSTCTKASVSKLFFRCSITCANTKKRSGLPLRFQIHAKAADQMAVSASSKIWKFCILSNRKHLYIYYNIVFAICQPFSAQKPAKNANCKYFNHFVSFSEILLQKVHSVLIFSSFSTNLYILLICIACTQTPN